MKKSLFQFIILLFVMFHSISLMAQEKVGDISWSVIANLPSQVSQKHLGLAGVFAGVHNDMLIIAGGANFPEAMPWKGGKKKFWDDIYVLCKDKSYRWITPQSSKLKQRIAYGASVTLPQGIVCIGGETEKGITKDVFLLQWDRTKNDIVIKDLPSLPFPLANASATAIGSSIYVSGGENEKIVSSAFLFIDLAAEKPVWRQLTDLPIAVSHSVAVTQTDGTQSCVYVIGGRTRTASGISDLHNTLFCYQPTSNSWKQLSSVSDGNSVFNLSAATGIAYGSNNILVMGGDKGTIFHQIETFNVNIAKASSDAEIQQLQANKLKLLTNHPGFSKDVLLYNTIANEWKKVGELPFSQVTTTAVKWNDSVIIPSGEIKPGVRTPEIVEGKLKP